MLVCPGLRVVPVTIHMALRDALAALTTERIVATGRIAAESLTRDFGVAKPRLAVAVSTRAVSSVPRLAAALGRTGHTMRVNADRLRETRAGRLVGAGFGIGPLGRLLPKRFRP